MRLPPILLFAIIAITLALVFYTMGVWSEKISKTLKPIHLIFFWIGFAFDTTGTALMGQMEKGAAANPIHAVTGVLAIVLMLGHAIWASVILLQKNDARKRSFHKFSIVVWLIWLIPYISGLIVGMSR